MRSKLLLNVSIDTTAAMAGSVPSGLFTALYVPQTPSIDFIFYCNIKKMSNNIKLFKQGQLKRRDFFERTQHNEKP